MDKHSNEELVERIFSALKQITKTKRVMDGHFLIRMKNDVVTVLVNEMYEIDYLNIDKLIKHHVKGFSFLQFPYELEFPTASGRWQFLSKAWLDEHVFPGTEYQMNAIADEIASFKGFIHQSDEGFTLTEQQVFIYKKEGYHLFIVTYQRYLMWCYDVSDWTVLYK